MSKCLDCQKTINKPFVRCWSCNRSFREREERARYDAMTPQEREDELDLYYSTECTMCGKEGADIRSDGKAYCSRCWTVWNS